MIPFSKYTGAGNDFVLVEDGGLGGRDPSRLARLLCPRATGVGVDGLVLLRRETDGSLAVRFFNPDGSEFGTCGNGTRCAARYAMDRGLVEGERLRVVTDQGEVGVRVDGPRVELEYRLESWIEGERDVPYGGEARTGWLVHVGTPHFVLPLERLPRGPIEDRCRPIRSHPALGPDGANVDLVRVDREGEAEIRTFERGVEGETAACGSGAMASTLALHAAGRCGRRLALRTRSGATLEVELMEDVNSAARPPGEPRIRRIRLAGPARGVFRGEYPLPPKGARETPAGD